MLDRGITHARQEPVVSQQIPIETVARTHTVWQAAAATSDRDVRHEPKLFGATLPSADRLEAWTIYALRCLLLLAVVVLGPLLLTAATIGLVHLFLHPEMSSQFVLLPLAGAAGGQGAVLIGKLLRRAPTVPTERQRTRSSLDPPSSTTTPPGLTSMPRR